jgi:DNA-binding MarR family transcriptional regulator
MSAQRLSQPQVIDDLLLYRINRLLQVAGSMVIRLCEGRFGITRREWRVIAVLASRPGLLSSQLAERAQLDRARTSRAVSSLVAKKLVHREAGPGDRRQVRLALTKEGDTLYREMFPLVRQINRELLSDLSGAEAAALQTMLERMQERADQMVAQADLPKADRRRGGRARASSG